jgi:hypothetical protein
VGVHSSAIACGMILDEGRVWGCMLFTLCSVTSLSLGWSCWLKRGRKLPMAGAGKNILGIFRLRFLVRQSTTTGPAVPHLTSPHALLGNLWSSRDIEGRPLLIGHDTSSPLHSLGKGPASVTKLLWHSSQKILLWGDSGAEHHVEGHCPASVSATCEFASSRTSLLMID